MPNRSNGIHRSNGAKSPAASPASSNGSAATKASLDQQQKKAPECATRPPKDTSAEFRQLVVQEQVRSLRRRLWHAFQKEDADTALRAYKATVQDLQSWVQEEIQEAKDREARRLQEEKEKKEAQRPNMMKRLSLAAVGPSSNKKSSGESEDQKGKNNRSTFRRRSSATANGGTTAKESASSFFPKLKKPPPSPPKAETTTHAEIELIMADIKTDGAALLPVHMNPSEPFRLDDYKNPLFEIDPNTGESRSVAAMTEESDHAHPPTTPSTSHSSRHFKAFRKRKTKVAQPRTPFWSSLKMMRRNDAAATAGTALGDAEDSTDALESASSPDSPTFQDAQTVAMMDPKMTTPLHEAARLGNAELVRLMLAQPFAEPNFKNGQKRTALHMVAGGWTEVEERLWRTRQQKMETKLNHKKKQQGGSLKTGSAHAKIGISAPLPVVIESAETAENPSKDGNLVGAKKAAKAMSRFFNSTFSTSNSKDSDEGSSQNKKKAPLTESQRYLLWDEQLWNKLRNERMDCLLAVMSWCHPDDGTASAGEGASVNAVDAQGRTALHYAAELGREDVCMAVLSSFGAMLTVVDEMARTPCELAAEQNHPELASQLEARALLYSDPYGMDDELLAAVMDEQRQPNTDELKIGEHENAAIEKARIALAPPFSWFKTLSIEEVDKERKKRLAECCVGMMTFVRNKEEEKELENVMYGMKDDDDEDAGDKDDANNSDAGSKHDSEKDTDNKSESADSPVTETKDNTPTNSDLEDALATSEDSNDVASEAVSDEEPEMAASKTKGEDSMDARNTVEAAEKVKASDADVNNVLEPGKVDEVHGIPAEDTHTAETTNITGESQENIEPPDQTPEAAPNTGESQEHEEQIASTSNISPGSEGKQVGQPKDDTADDASTRALSGSKTGAAKSKSASELEVKDERYLSSDELCSLKSIQTSHIAQFLARQGWIVEDALEKYTENPMKALEEAGVALRATYDARKRAGAKETEDENEESINSGMCQICFDDFDIADGENWTHLINCSHSFCNSCLGDYLDVCAKSRSTGLSVPCPHHACGVPMSQPEIKTLAPNQEVHNLLQQTTNDNFIASASDLRFCSHPGCIGVVKVSISAAMKRFGVNYDFLSCADAVCTAVHPENLDESKIDIGAGDTPPVTYEGVVDLQLTDVRKKTPPTCAHRFCFGCGESGRHFPVDCDSLEEWKKKIMDEVEQVTEDGDGPESGEKYEDVAQRLWMRANTRPCPKCKAPIEKNEGCNHMTCFNPQCKHEFCWICRKDWKLHNTATGGFFRCNRWQDEDKHDFYDTPPPADQMPPRLTAEEAANDDVMSNPEVMAQTYGTAMHEHRIAWKKSKEMKRFLHHYTRWNAHMESAALEKLMSENVCDRLAPVVDAAADFMCDANFSFGGKGLSFVHAAFKELLECRSVLQHSYAYSFFKFESLAFKRQRQGKRAWNEKTAFEQLQSELEIITEQMSDIVARSHLRATQTQILFLTVGASERRNEFSNLIFTLLREEKKREQNAALIAAKPPRSSRSLSTIPIASIGGNNVRSAGAGTLVVQGLANGEAGDGDDDETQAERQQQATETVREALMASLEAFMANTDEHPTFVAHVDAGDDDDEDGNSDANGVIEQEDDEDDGDDEEFNSWACSACTYMNTTGRHCAMCGTPPVGA